MEEVNYFKGIYSQGSRSNLEQKIKDIKLFPRLFNEDEGKQVGVEVDIKEVKEVLFQFAKDKILKPDGWPTKFLFTYLT